MFPWQFCPNWAKKPRKFASANVCILLGTWEQVQPADMSDFGRWYCVKKIIDIWKRFYESQSKEKGYAFEWVVWLKLKHGEK